MCWRSPRTIESEHGSSVALSTGHKQRVDNSAAFLTDAKPAKIVRLKLSVTQQIDLLTDSLRVYGLGPLTGEGDQRVEFVGVTRTFTGPREAWRSMSAGQCRNHHSDVLAGHLRASCDRRFANSPERPAQSLSPTGRPLHRGAVVKVEFGIIRWSP